MPSMYRDYCTLVIGMNQSVYKKAQFQCSYLTALSGKLDMRAKETKPEPYRSLRGPVADRVNQKDYKYAPISADIYGLTPRCITAKQQRERALEV